MWSSSVEPFKGQKYSALKKQALSSGRPFQDPEFLPNEQSLFYERGHSAGIEWKRPGVWRFNCILSLLKICTFEMLIFMAFFICHFNFCVQSYEM